MLLGSRGARNGPPQLAFERSERVAPLIPPVKPAPLESTRCSGTAAFGRRLVSLLISRGCLGTIAASNGSSDLADRLVPETPFLGTKTQSIALSPCRRPRHF